MYSNTEIIKKYEEMVKSGKTEDFFDPEHFGELKIFINTIPKTVLFPLKIDPDNTVYLGSN